MKLIGMILMGIGILALFLPLPLLINHVRWSYLRVEPHEYLVPLSLPFTWLLYYLSIIVQFFEHTPWLLSFPIGAICIILALKKI